MGCCPSKRTEDHGENSLPLSHQLGSDNCATVTLDDPNATQITFDPNRIVAQGGYCDVFMGADPTGRRIALKRYRITMHGYGKEDLQVIENEAKVWRGLEHEFILPFLGIGQDSTDFWYLASPWMDNGILPTFLRENSETADRPRFILEVAEALHYLESKKVIHGDIKAANILVSPDHHALLCDFGLSKLVSVATQKPLKGAGSTPWQSPEILKNEPKSYASDIYAFGMTIYEVLTGNLPFHDHQPTAIVNAVVYENKRPNKPQLRGSHQYLWDIAERCWKVDPDDRPSIQTVLRWIQRRKCDPPDNPHGPSSSSSGPQAPLVTPTERRARSDSHRIRPINSTANVSHTTTTLPPLPQDPGSGTTPIRSVLDDIIPDTGGRSSQNRKPHGILRRDSPRLSNASKVENTAEVAQADGKQAVGTSTSIRGSQATQTPRSVSFASSVVERADDVVSGNVPQLPTSDGRSAPLVSHQDIPVPPEHRAPPSHSSPRRSDSQNRKHTSDSQQPDSPAVLGSGATGGENVRVPGGNDNNAPRLYKRGEDGHSDTPRGDPDSTVPKLQIHTADQLPNPNAKLIRSKVAGADTSRESDLKHDATDVDSGNLGEDSVMKPRVTANELYSTSPGNKRDKVSERSHGTVGPHSSPSTNDLFEQVTKGVGAGSPPLAESKALERPPRGSSSANPPAKPKLSLVQSFPSTPPSETRARTQEVPSQPTQPTSTTSDRPDAGSVIDLTDLVESHHADRRERLRVQHPRTQIPEPHNVSSDSPLPARPSNQTHAPSSSRREDVTPNRQVTPLLGSNNNTDSTPRNVPAVGVPGREVTDVPRSNSYTRQGHVQHRPGPDETAPRPAPVVPPPSTVPNPNTDHDHSGAPTNLKAALLPAHSTSANRQHETDPTAQDALLPDLLNQPSSRGRERGPLDTYKPQRLGHAADKAQPMESASNVIQSGGPVKEPSQAPEVVSGTSSPPRLDVPEDFRRQSDSFAVADSSSLDSEYSSASPSPGRPRPSKPKKPVQSKKKGARW